MACRPGVHGMKTMKTGTILLSVLAILCLPAPGEPDSGKNRPPARILLVSSYHSEYLWSIETNGGFCDALLSLGYLDNRAQADEYTRNDYVETPRAVIKKFWMDTKRKKSDQEKSSVTVTITEYARHFRPDIIILGDDEAAEYVGAHFLDSPVPIVFWGLNHNPVKYGLVDSAARPGHNVTGVYQSGYHVESVRLLMKIVPTVKTFAILSDDTPSGRSNLKEVEYLARTGEIPLKLVASVSTNDSTTWRRKALELQDKVDAFYVAQYSGLKDSEGKPVPDPVTANWYITTIRKPEFAGFRFRVEEGMLCAVDDSGYNQAYEAVLIAHRILTGKASPATHPVRAPKRGARVVNRQRAETLGIRLTEDMGIEKYIDRAASPPEAPK